MSQYLSVDNIIGVQPTTTSSTNLQAKQVDIYNGTTNFHRLTSSASNPLIGITIPDASGTMTLNTATQTLTNKMNHAQVGSASDPSYSFSGNLNLGLFRAAANTIGITCAGVQRVSVSDTLITALIPVRATNFQAALGGYPNCHFTNSTDTTTGMIFGTSDTVGIQGAGQPKFTFGSSKNTSFLPLVLPDGSYANPSLQFSSYPTTGLVAGGGATPTLYLVTNGSVRAQFSQNGNYFPAQIQAKDGASNDPGISFVNSQDSGLYRKGTNDLRFSISSSDSLSIQQNGILLYGSVAGNNSGYSASKLGYYEEYAYNTKFYFPQGQSTAVSINCKITRIGNLVTLFVPQWSSTAITNNSGGIRQCFTDTNIPTRFLPGTTLPILVTRAYVTSGGTPADILINIYIQTGGAGASILTIEKNIATYFANGDIFYMYGTTMSWII